MRYESRYEVRGARYENTLQAEYSTAEVISYLAPRTSYLENPRSAVPLGSAKNSKLKTNPDESETNQRDAASQCGTALPT